MTHVQKLLLPISAIIVGLTVASAYVLSQTPTSSLHVRTGFLCLGEVLFLVGMLRLSRSGHSAERSFPFSLGLPSIWFFYTISAFAVLLFGAKLPLPKLWLSEAILLGVTVVIRLIFAMGEHSIDTQEDTDHVVLVWRKDATARAADIGGVILEAFPGDAKIHKAVDDFCDGFRYAGSSTTETAGIECKIDSLLDDLDGAVKDKQQEVCMRLMAEIMQQLQTRNRIAR